MNIIPRGDYYAWYCEWCDTENLTLQQRFAAGVVACGACHKHFMPGDVTGSGKELALAGGF